VRVRHEHDPNSEQHHRPEATLGGDPGKQAILAGPRLGVLKHVWIFAGTAAGKPVGVRGCK
jgi:hypothetical protein